MSAWVMVIFVSMTGMAWRHPSRDGGRKFWMRVVAVGLVLVAAILATLLI